MLFRNKLFHGLSLDNAPIFPHNDAPLEMWRRGSVMIFDESKLNETSVGVLITTLEDYVKKVEALLSKYKEGFKDENGTVNELREGVKSDLNLKKDLCKKVITSGWCYLS